MKSNKPALMERASFKSIVSSLLAILMGLVVGFIIILIANPSDALQGLSILLTGGFREGLSSIGQVIYLAVPIMMTGLSVSFAYKCGEFNIGVPGQYLVGCFTAVFIALRATFIPDNLVWIFAILGAGIAGALWALIPGILKKFARNVNVVISGIMCNYIGMLLVIQGIKATIYNSTGAESYAVSKARSIPGFGLNQIFGDRVNLGIIIAILLCVLAWFIMNKTTFGYELKACGFNKDLDKICRYERKEMYRFSPYDFRILCWSRWCLNLLMWYW